MKLLFTAMVLTLSCLTACTTGGKTALLFDEAAFLKVNERIYPPATFEYVGGGMRGGSRGDLSDMVLRAVYRPKDPAQTGNIDLSEWASAVTTRETFPGQGEGGSRDMYYSHDWDNDNRVIKVDAVILKDGNILVTYHEIIR